MHNQPFYDAFALDTLLEYGRAVEQSTLSTSLRFRTTKLKRKVTDEDGRGQKQEYTVDGLLWHVMIHEMRHTTQIAVLRLQGIKPPSLDLLFYLPTA